MFGVAAVFLSQGLEPRPLPPTTMNLNDLPKIRSEGMVRCSGLAVGRDRGQDFRPRVHQKLTMPRPTADLRREAAKAKAEVS